MPATQRVFCVENPNKIWDNKPMDNNTQTIYHLKYEPDPEHLKRLQKIRKSRTTQENNLIDKANSIVLKKVLTAYQNQTEHNHHNNMGQ